LAKFQQNIQQKKTYLKIFKNIFGKFSSKFGLFHHLRIWPFLKLIMAKFGLFYFLGPGNPGISVKRKFKLPHCNIVLFQFNTTGQLASNGSLTINGTVFHPNNGESYHMDRPIGNSTSNPGI
jgi:hypothetical protein